MTLQPLPVAVHSKILYHLLSHFAKLHFQKGLMFAVSLPYTLMKNHIFLPIHYYSLTGMISFHQKNSSISLANLGGHCIKMIWLIWEDIVSKGFG